jgi:hypothetical protein
MEKMSKDEFMLEVGSDLVDDFLIDNKEFDRMVDEAYEDYVKGGDL